MANTFITIEHDFPCGCKLRYRFNNNGRFLALSQVRDFTEWLTYMAPAHVRDEDHRYIVKWTPACLTARRKYRGSL